MTYLTKTKENETKVVYSYGKQEGEYIGSVSFEKDIRHISEGCFEFEYFNKNTFCRTTVNAVKAISSFIAKGEFPEHYLRATH